MSLSQMEVFNDFLMPATIETLDQMVDEFNEASNNTIILTAQGHVGDYLEQSFYQALHTSQRRVDRYSANTDVAATDLSQDKNVSVKIAGGFGPIRFEPSQLTWLLKDTDEAVEVISRQLAEVIMQDQLNTGIAAAVAAISNNVGTVIDVSGGSKITQGVLNNSHALFGDRSQSLQAEVMTGTQYHNLVGDAIANNNRLFVAENILVVEILNKPVVVTDAPALREAGATNKQKVLSLSAGAIQIDDGSEVITNVDVTNGKNRIEATMQADYDFTAGLKGYAWDVANGGASPSDADIATGSNWDQVATYTKQTAGVIAIGDE